MATQILFTERQHFRQWWLWFLLIGLDLFFIYQLIMQVFLRQPFGDRPMSNNALISVTISLLLFTVFFRFLRLDTRIQEDGIYYRYLPFQLKYRQISWERISQAFVRKYSPITEYGGWGIRIGLFGKGQAFNVSGNKGLQLVYDTGKKFLIGTRRPEEIQQVLNNLGHAPQK